jgi:hypothetical protein
MIFPSPLFSYCQPWSTGGEKRLRPSLSWLALSPSGPSSPPYLLSFPCAVLNPLQEHVAVTRPGDPLETRDVVIIDVDVEHGKVTLDVMPLGKGLQGLQQGFILDPRDEFGRSDHVVYYALQKESKIVTFRSQSTTRKTSLFDLVHLRMKGLERCL